MLEVEGFILAGGASSRMGTDKALLDLGGKLFLEKIAETLARVTKSVRVVGAGRANDLGLLPQVPDIYPQWGALGGLHAALDACQTEWAAIVACDLPFITGELFVRLASLSENFEAVIPVQPDGRLQPLCALYRAKPCAAVSRALIEGGERRPRALLQKIKARQVAPHELSDLSGATRFFMNINTPEDYLQARKAITSDE